MSDILRKLTEDPDVDHEEIQEWVESLADLKARYGAEKTGEILAYLQDMAFRQGIHMPFTANTPYMNTIPVEEQPAFPGDRELEPGDLCLQVRLLQLQRRGISGARGDVDGEGHEERRILHGQSIDYLAIFRRAAGNPDNQCNNHQHLHRIHILPKEVFICLTNCSS